MKIAAFQRRPVFDDLDRTCREIVRDLRWAEGEGIDLVLLPEGILLGHSYGRETIVRRAAAVSAGALDALRSATAGLRPTCVLGAFEEQGDSVTNSAFVIQAGNVIGRYAKAYPNEPGVRAGSAFPVFVHQTLRYGIGICNDANHSDVAQRFVAQGASLILYPLNNMLPARTADRWREKHIANLRQRARETGCWVVSADVTGSQGEHISYGCTAVVNPDGEVVARVAEGAEGVAMWEIGPKS